MNRRVGLNYDVETFVGAGRPRAFTKSKGQTVTIATDFNTPTTGFNARASALAAAAVAAYDNTTREAVDAVLAERASLADAIIRSLIDSTSLGATSVPSAWGESRNPGRFIESVWLVVREASLNDVLPAKLDGDFPPSSANGFDPSVSTAAAVTKIAALEARFAAAAA